MVPAIFGGTIAPDVDVRQHVESIVCPRATHHGIAARVGEREAAT